MNGIFILQNSAGLAPLTAKQPAALLHLADAPLLAHLLRQLGKTGQKALVLTPAADLEPVAAWLEGQSWGADVTLISFDPAADSLTGIRDAGRLPRGEPLFLATDRAIAIPDWAAAAAAEADIVSFGPAALWLRSGELLSRFAIPDEISGYDNLVSLSPAGETVTLRPPVYLPLTSVAELLHANQRLLGIGYSSPDALERSYTEEFAIIPPVFIDPTAEIIASVIGPYAAVAAGALVEDSIVSRSVIGPEASISDALLQNSYAGRQAVIEGRPATIIAPENDQIEIRSETVWKRE